MGELPTIRLLPAELRDQIAAGEVVERPASVVKELVENSLDAGARSVRIEIDGGGLERILVTDDGHGMTRESAVLCLERHATSKLSGFDDLFRLMTFGFRGEALPSIASVSRFKLTTRTREALEGVEVEYSPGEPPHVREVGAPQGTSIEVRELFYNVPARRKFLKSVATESGHVGDACLDLALSRHDVALTLVRDGRVARQYLRGKDRAARAREALGRALSEGRDGVEELAHVTAERTSRAAGSTVKLEGLISPPERARSGATGLHFVVNGRAVRDRLLARAVAMAYGSVLDPGRYPIGVVYVDVPTDEVDVNVHPQKAEVRFARGRDFYDDVTRGLASALADTFRRPGVRAPMEEARSARSSSGDDAPMALRSHPASSVDRGVRELSEAMERTLSPFADSGRKAPSARVAPASREADPWGLSAQRAEGMPFGAVPATRASDGIGPAAPIETTMPAAVRTSSPTPRPPVPEAPPNAAPREGDENVETTLVSPSSPTTTQLGQLARDLAADRVRPAGSYGSLRFVAQVRATYLICEGLDGIYVLDQHAAAERVNYARLKAAYASRSVARQQLLVPEVVAVSSAESALIDELRDSLLAFGVDARAIGDGRVAVHGIPALMAKAPPATLLRDLLDEVARSGERSFSDAADLVLATMACHGSVRAGDAMHPDECTALLRALDEVDFAGYCPHGRPIVTTLPYVELEKKVGRR